MCAYDVKKYMNNYNKKINLFETAKRFSFLFAVWSRSAMHASGLDTVSGTVMENEKKKLSITGNAQSSRNWNRNHVRIKTAEKKLIE